MYFALGVGTTRAKRTGEAHPLLLPDYINNNGISWSSKDTVDDPVVAVIAITII